MDKTKILLITTLITLLSILPLISNVNANPTVYDKNVYLHEHASVTVASGITTTHTMNTSALYSSSAQVWNNSYTSTTAHSILFYLYPRLAGQLSLSASVSNPLESYLVLEANETVTANVTLTVLDVTNSSSSSTIATQSWSQKEISAGTYQFIISTSASATISAGHTIGFNITIWNSNATAYIWLYYDSSSYNSRLELPCSDHITVTVNTYSGTTASTEFAYQETINITATVTDAFGGYDINTAQLYFIPEGFSSVILPSGYGTGIRISGSDTAYTNVYYYLYTPNSTEYVPNRWTPYARVTDLSDNTITNSGTKIGVSGPGGEQPPPEPPIPLPDIFYIFGPQLAMVLFVALIFFIVIVALAIYIVLKGSK